MKLKVTVKVKVKIKLKVCANADVNVNGKVNAKQHPEHKAHPNTIKYLYAHCAQDVSVRRGA